MATKYRPTVIIGNDELIALHDGTMTMQCGQWFRLMYSDKKARWVGLTRTGSLWAVHWDNGHDARQFKGMCRSMRLGKAKRMSRLAAWAR
jgi:hypothetical protein